MVDVLGPVRRLGAALPHLPWYGWAAAGVGAVALLAGASSAAASPAVDEPPPVPPGPLPTVREGDHGPAVGLLRWLLTLPAGEDFDAATDAAVRAYQKAMGLTADGIVGPKTWEALGVEGAASPSPTPPDEPAVPKPAPSPSPGPKPAPAPSGGNPLGISSDLATRWEQILGFVAANEVRHEWAWLEYDACGHHVRLLVSRRALALESGGHVVIPSVSYRVAQAIADMTQSALPTTRILDEIHRQASKELQPLTRPITSSTAAMLDQSAKIEAAVGGASGLVSNEGKDWVITRRFWTEPEKKGRSANFGWYSKVGKSQTGSPGGEDVIQSVGLTHDLDHDDYSQLLRLVNPGSLSIDGNPISWAAALASPTLSCAVQDEGGVIPSPRHPEL